MPVVAYALNRTIVLFWGFSVSLFNYCLNDNIKYSNAKSKEALNTHLVWVKKLCYSNYCEFESVFGEVGKTFGGRFVEILNLSTLSSDKL